MNLELIFTCHEPSLNKTVIPTRNQSNKQMKIRETNMLEKTKITENQWETTKTYCWKSIASIIGLQASGRFSTKRIRWGCWSSWDYRESKHGSDMHENWNHGYLRLVSLVVFIHVHLWCWFFCCYNINTVACKLKRSWKCCNSQVCHPHTFKSQTRSITTMKISRGNCRADLITFLACPLLILISIFSFQ